MQTTIPTHGPISWARRRMPAAVAWALRLLLVFGFALTAAGQSALTQSDGPLNFGNNFFVTGDYVVAGAYGLGVNAPAANGFATGRINVPDADPVSGISNPGITGTKAVPAGAQIVAALLYWQTVEKSNQLGFGQNGFFRPVFQVPPPGGQPAPYPITGVNLNGQNTVSFSGGGCTGSSTGGKVVRSYRADVRSFLPRDASGNVLVNSTDGVTFEVRLPSNPNATLPTLGATLVIIYRVLSPTVLLNSIVIYDGGFSPGNTLYTMTQTVRGFYQAAQNPVSRLTHIVGNGHNYKFQTVSLGTNTTALTPLPPLYASGQPFPGYYGSWDNTTWTFPYPKIPVPPNYPPNPVHENDASATTMVVPNTSAGGCVSWSAVIVSTTVHDDDKDGILPFWKSAKGYTDVATGKFVSLADLNDQPQTGQQDVFIQLDHVVDVDSNGNPVPNGNFTPDPAAVSLVKKAFVDHNIHLHINGGNPNNIGGNAVPVPTCIDKVSPPQLCPYPNQQGIITWRDGFEFVKNQLIDTSGQNVDCTTSSPPASCVPRFPIAQRNSHHYVVFGDALGGPNWAFLGGTLTGVVLQSDNTVTFNTSIPHGLCRSTDLSCPKGIDRVTITGAITNLNPNGTYLNLNGTYLVTGVSCPLNDCTVKNTEPGPYTFTIKIGSSSVSKPTSFTLQTDPNLAVASGQGGTGSGFSDVGGSGTLHTLGHLWGANATVRKKAGTLMHELGHTLGLTHGGFYYDKLAQNPQDYTPTVEANCKPNYHSVMNYMFQFTLLGPNGVLDLSSQHLDTLTESPLSPGYITTTSGSIAFPTTDWYDISNQYGVGTKAKHHCDGTLISSTDVTPTMFYYSGGTQTAGLGTITPDPAWSHTPLDINFDGKTSALPFRGYDDWANIDLRQVGATGSVLSGPGGLFSGPGGLFTGPGGFFTGPGGLFSGPGGFFSGPGGLFSGPGGLFSGPGGLFSGPGGLFSGPGASGGEIDLATALSVTHPPSSLKASEDASPRIIHLSWNASVDTTENYKIYRSSDNGTTFSFLKLVDGTSAPPPGTVVVVTSDDTVTCNPNGYKYFVTAVVLNTTIPLSQDQHQESVPSNTAPTTTPPRLTGCYTNTPNTFPTPPLTDLAFPPNPNVHGSLIPITWTLQVDNPTSYANPSVTYVNNLVANTLDAIGPLQPSVGGACPTSAPAGPVIHLLSEGNVINPPNSTSTYGVSTGPNYQFTFRLDTDVLSSGCYFLKLTTTGNGQSETTTSALQLQIDVTDTDNPHVTTTALPDATVGVSYNNTLTQDGGVGATLSIINTVANGTTAVFTVPNTVNLSAGQKITVTDCTTAGLNASYTITSVTSTTVTVLSAVRVTEAEPAAALLTTFIWAVVSGALPPGTSLSASGTLSGTPTASGPYNFMVKVTDSVGNFGTQTLTLTIDGLLFAGTDFNTFSNVTPDQLGRFTINGSIKTGGGVLSVPYHINGMAQAGNFLYAGDPLSNTLRSIDFNGNPVNNFNVNGSLVSSVTAGFPSTCCNEAMVFDAVGNVLWHAHWDESTTTSHSEIEKLDPSTGAVITAYPQPDVVGITFVGNTIWITHWAAQQVGTWNPATSAFTMKFSTAPFNAGGLAYDPVNGTLWVGLESSPNFPGGSVVPYDPVAGTPKGAGFSPFVNADAVDGLAFVSDLRAPLPSGIVSWWPAEGTFTDIIGGYNGTPSGGVGFAPGEVGQTFSFNGVGGEIQVADNANLDVGQITIEAWVKPTTPGHGRPIVQKRSSVNVGGYTFETTDTSDGPGPANGLQFAVWINGTQSLLQTPANALTIGAWQHVAATYDGSTMKIYVNGVLQANQAVSGTIDSDSADPLVMGLNVTNASYDWSGFMDEVSLYNRALTATEIQTIVNAGGAGKAKP